MQDYPLRYTRIADVPKPVLWGLIHEHGTAARAASYEHDWQRDPATLGAVLAALEAAADGQRPATERPGPPAWLAPLVRDEVKSLATRWHQSGGFSDVRLLERAGLVALEPDDDYVLALVGGLGDRWGRISRAGQLRADPELLDQLWRIFEVEGGGEISLANIDKFSDPAASWKATITELAADGTLDRQRVLRSCLDALRRDFTAYRAGWYSRQYVSLGPTRQEAAQHQDHYRALLRSKVSATVSLAARHLRRVSAAGDLDDEQYDSLRAGLVAQAKGAALDIIRVLDDIGSRRADLRPALADVAAAGLDHPHADVQRATVRLLAGLGADALAEDAVDGLAATIQRQLGHTPASFAPALLPEPVAPARLVGCSPADIPERTAALLEDASDPVEVELVLAGLAQLGRPASLQPLAKRARAILQRGPREGVTGGWLRGHLARLVLASVGEPAPPLQSRTYTPRTRFLLRLLALVEAVLSDQHPPVTLLATPTTTDGYLEPAQLLHRLAGRSGRPQPEDLTAAILRLAPDGRDQALARVRGDDEIALVLRHALGAPYPGRERRAVERVIRRGTPALWAAASRTRAPRDDDPVLLAAGLTGAGQGRPVRATLSPQLTIWDRYGQHAHWRYALRIQYSAGGEYPDRPALPTDREYAAQVVRGLEDWIGWLVLSAPHDLEPVLPELMFAVLHSDWNAYTSYEASRLLSALTQHPGVPGTLGTLTLAAGMTGNRAEHRVLAADASAGFAASGRLSAADLAAAMAQLAGPAKPGRWAGSLASLAQALPGPFVTDLLTTLIPALDPRQRGIHALLELLLEESARHNRKITDPSALAWLAKMAGSSRTAQTARNLLML